MPAATKWPAAILFDFDGVLVNSEPLHFQALAWALDRETINLTESEYYNEVIGVDDKSAIKHFFEKNHRVLDPKTYLRCFTNKLERMRSLIEDRRYRALPGVEEFVRGVWRHYPLAVVSAAVRDEIDAMLIGVSLRDCFTEVVAIEDVTHPKPDPEGYLAAMERLARRQGKTLRPQDCLVIEDSPRVAKRVREEGFVVLGVTTSYPAEKLSDCDHVVPSLRPDDVLKVLPTLDLGV
jgi:beta-phosphoglucomutase